MNTTETTTSIASTERKIYKKTDRVRNTKSHEALNDAIREMTAICDDLAGMEIDVMIARSTEQRYARALFDLSFGDMVTIHAKTSEEIYAILMGVRIAHQLTKISSVDLEQEAA